LLDRRNLMIGTVAAGASLAWPLPMQARTRDLHFEARREGDRIGSHTVRFGMAEGRLIVDIEISFTVSFAFIPLYRYRHHNRELWADGSLIRLDSKTDDDGAEHWVSARAEGQQLVVESSSGSRALPRDTLPTSYWNESMVTRGAWLDTQSGRLVRSEVEALPGERILAAGRTVEATRYRLAGEIDCELWYDRGHWSKLRFAASDGSVIDYALLQSGADAP
jgi:hypothetical protein